MATTLPDKSPSKEARRIGDLYLRVFMGSDDGQAVLKDLQSRFPSDAIRFRPGGSATDAAFIDGAASVTRKIEVLIETGKKQNP